jgi:hypothetical protein
VCDPGNCSCCPSDGGFCPNGCIGG